MSAYKLTASVVMFGFGPQSRGGCGERVCVSFSSTKKRARSSEAAAAVVHSPVSCKWPWHQESGAFLPEKEIGVLLQQLREQWKSGYQLEKMSFTELHKRPTVDGSGLKSRRFGEASFPFPPSEWIKRLEYSREGSLGVSSRRMKVLFYEDYISGTKVKSTSS